MTGYPRDLCNVCSSELPREASRETAMVRSNIRRFQTETFALYRCPNCESLHARDEVDLDHYYRGYPLLDLELDWGQRMFLGNYLKRLRKAGISRDHRILDYGCGSGHFIEFLKASGYPRVTGYDFYSEKFRDPRVLEEKYDFIIAQDVLEHVEEPRALMATLGRLVRPSGIICIGTPDAAALDLARPEELLYAFHQPYHRHILSTRALLVNAKQLGWTLEKYYSTTHLNLLFPLMNVRFIAHYLGLYDNSLDLLSEPLRMSNPRMWTPITLFFAFFGYFFCPKADIMAIFRAPKESSGPPTVADRGGDVPSDAKTG